MAAVKAPVAGWSGESVCGVVFVDGAADTDDEAALRYFRSAGYEVTEDSEPVPSESWTNAELEEWAQAHDVDLGDAKKKADILAAIELAQAGGDN